MDDTKIEVQIVEVDDNGGFDVVVWESETEEHLDDLDRTFDTLDEVYQYLDRLGLENGYDIEET